MLPETERSEIDGPEPALSPSPEVTETTPVTPVIAPTAPAVPATPPQESPPQFPKLDVFTEKVAALPPTLAVVTPSPPAAPVSENLADLPLAELEAQVGERLDTQA